MPTPSSPSSSWPAPRILICPDAYKGTLSAREATEAIAAGLAEGLPDAQLRPLPLADGGPGTLDLLAAHLPCRWDSLQVRGPLGAPTRAAYLSLADGTVVIEMARAAGLHLVPVERRDVLRASTFGVGELIHAALDQAAPTIVVTLGGSATCDGGIGMLQALGARLLDARGRELAEPGVVLDALDLERVASIDLRQLDPGIPSARLLGLVDVLNPLCGEQGAAAVYGPQKGASVADVARLDAGLARWGGVLETLAGRPVADLPGAGAAGGLGAALIGGLGGALVGGFDWLAAAIGLDRYLAQADLVVTGEGRIDLQTAQGKTVAGVARWASARQVPVVVLAGCALPSAPATNAPAANEAAANEPAHSEPVTTRLGIDLLIAMSGPDDQPPTGDEAFRRLQAAARDAAPALAELAARRRAGAAAGAAQRSDHA